MQTGLFKIIEEEMLSRMDYITLKPEKILAGGETHALVKRYPHAKITLLENASIENNYDLIFVNMVLPWRNDFAQTLQAWCSALRQDGLLMLSCLGLDTLKEMSNEKSSQLKLYDMHDVGDALSHAGFADPVLDVEQITLRYRDAKTLSNEMLAYHFISHELISSPLTLTLEVIYAHAWGTDHYAADEEGTVRIPISRLRKQI